MAAAQCWFGGRGRSAGAALQLRFELRDRPLQLLELLARAQQHRALHVELLARDQVELAQAGLQHRLEVLLQFLAALAHARRHQVAEAAGEVVDVAEVDHGVLHWRWRASGGFPVRGSMARVAQSAQSAGTAL